MTAFLSQTANPYLRVKPQEKRVSCFWILIKRFWSTEETASQDTQENMNGKMSEEETGRVKKRVNIKKRKNEGKWASGSRKIT